MATIKDNVSELLTHIKNVANNVRNVLGAGENILPDALPSKVNDVYAIGKKQGVNEWFAKYQYNGAFGDYNYRFYKFTDEVYKPVFPIKSKNSSGMFEYSNITDTIVPITIKEGTETSRCANIFSAAKWLRRIPKLIVEHLPTKSPVPHYSKWFHLCESLEEIMIVGTIASSISFVYSPLNLASAKNIITNNLVNFWEWEGYSDYSQKIEFSEYTWRLLDAEGDTASPYGTSWRDYVTEKGWSI